MKAKRKRKRIQRRTVSRHARRHRKSSPEIRAACKLAQQELLTSVMRLLTVLIDRYAPAIPDAGNRLDVAELERIYRL